MRGRNKRTKLTIARICRGKYIASSTEETYLHIDLTASVFRLHALEWWNGRITMTPAIVSATHHGLSISAAKLRLLCQMFELVEGQEDRRVHQPVACLAHLSTQEHIQQRQKKHTHKHGSLKTQKKTEKQRAVNKRG